jgi:acyl carrier protein
VSEWSTRVAVIDALGKIVKSRADWQSKSQDPDFDLSMAELAIDSLDALELCMEIETNTGVELEPAELVPVATISQLISLVASKDRRATSSLVRARRDRPLPLSLVQESIWNYCQSQDPSAYVIAIIDTIQGPLDVAKLAESLTAIVRRHEIMRTTFPVVDGRPIQMIHPAKAVALPVIEVSNEESPEEAAERIIGVERASVSDLANGPLGRFVVIRIRDSEHLLVRLFHHLVWDESSGKLFFNELTSFYDADGNSAVSSDIEQLQYGDYAAWQRTAFEPAGKTYRDIVAKWVRNFHLMLPSSVRRRSRE